MFGDGIGRGADVLDAPPGTCALRFPESIDVVIIG